MHIKGKEPVSETYIKYNPGFEGTNARTCPPRIRTQTIWDPLIVLPHGLRHMEKAKQNRRRAPRARGSEFGLYLEDSRTASLVKVTLEHRPYHPQHSCSCPGKITEFPRTSSSSRPLENLTHLLLSC